MATRTITTVFTLKGENEYKQKIRDINREISLLNSSLLLSEQYYGDNADSVVALQDKYDKLTDVYDKQLEKVDKIKEALKYSVEAMQKYAEHGGELVDSLVKVNEELDKLKDSGDIDSDAYKSLIEQKESLERSIAKNSDSFNKFSTFADNWEINLNKAETELLGTKKAIDETASSLDSAKQNAGDFGGEMVETGEKAVGMKDKTTEALETIAAVASALGLEKVFGEIKNAIGDCITASMDFETALTGVTKTVSGTPEEMEQIKQGIKDLAQEIPASTIEIAGVAETAGQLGIAAGDIIDFTKVMVELGTATNMSSGEAASSLAKFANITGMASEDYERLGSVIVELGNNTATTESDIVSMATRLASSGELTGLSEAQIIAMAAALSSLGTEAESGGTAISKLLKKIETAVATYDSAKKAIEDSGRSLRDMEMLQSNHSKDFKLVADDLGLTAGELGKYVKTVRDMEDYSEIAGMSADEFAEAWGDDAVRALDKFVRGLNESDNAIQKLSEMGITEVRLSDAIQKMASSGNTLTNALDMAENAWEKNTALSEEAGRAYSTTASKMQILENKSARLKTAIGDDLITSATPALELISSLTGSLAETAEKSPAVSSGLIGVGTGLGTITAAAGAAGIIKAVTSALSLFGSTAVPAAAAVSVVAGIGAAAYNYYENITKLPEATQRFIDDNGRIIEGLDKAKETYENSGSMADTSRNKVDKLIERIAALAEKTEKTAGEKELIKSMVDELNGYLPGLGLTYDGLTEKINLTKEAMTRLADEAYNFTKLDALGDYLDSLNSGKLDLEISGDNLQLKYDEAVEQYDKAYNEWLESTKRGFVENFKAIFDSDIKSVNDYNEALMAARHEMEELESALADNKTAQEEADRELERANRLYEEQAASAYSQQLENRMQQLDDLKLKQKDLTLAFQTAASEAGISADSWQQSGEKFAETISSLSEEYQEKLNGIRDELINLQSDITSTKNIIEEAYKSGTEIGVAWSEGVIAGMRQMDSKVSWQSKKMGGIIDEMLKDELEIHSPSKKSYRHGINYGEGLVLGLTDKINDVKRASQKLADSTDIYDSIHSKASIAGSALSSLKTPDYSSDSFLVQHYSAENMLSRLRENSVYKNGGAISAVPTADFTNIIELDGEVIARKVSRVQWNENKVKTRNKGR